MSNLDVFEYFDGFYYFDENDDTIGPFKTAEQAQVASDASSKWSVREHKDDIRKMRRDMGT
jgi:hypothetical protein